VAERRRPGQSGIWRRIYSVPWWGLVLIAIGIWVGFSIAADEIYSRIFTQLRAGIEMTLRVSSISYSLALVLGLIVGVIRSSPPLPKKGLIGGALSFVRLLLYNAATLYVEVMRGLPVLIVLLISAFVIVPGIREILLETYGIQLPFRGASVETAIIGLSLTYGAFLSEIFRAGIQSIEKGQIEAARSLGMNYFQVMWLVVLPQAIRRVLPPLGNDFIAMIKDSSLVAILGIRDVTQIARVTSGSSFRYLETYLTVAVIYLTMTILGSLLVRLLERRTRQHHR
jgi:polar amino acid transport system permease protein